MIATSLPVSHENTVAAFADFIKEIAEIHDRYEPELPQILIVVGCPTPDESGKGYTVQYHGSDEYSWEFLARQVILGQQENALTLKEQPTDVADK